MEESSGQIHVGRVVPSEFTVVVNSMPPEWFVPEPHIVQLQIAEMFNSNRFLVAQIGQRLMGGVGWQENVAAGAYFAKFLFVRPDHQRSGVAVRLLRELITIGANAGQRAVFGDIPEDSPLREVADRIPGAREVGYIEEFHQPGVKSIIVSFDLREHKRLLREADRRIAAVPLAAEV
jgi:GNAT superfamily N-acetyltransferase